MRIHDATCDVLSPCDECKGMGQAPVVREGAVPELFERIAALGSWATTDEVERLRAQVTALTAEKAGLEQLLIVSNEQTTAVEARVITLTAALGVMVEMYVGLVNSGDCGSWDPETEAAVKHARAALKGA